jgi:hypothetical protein
LTNPSVKGLGRTEVTVFREIPFRHQTGAVEEDWHSYLASVKFNTIPPSFSKTIRFPAVPEEKIKFSVWKKGNTNLKIDYFQNSRRDTVYFTLPLVFD